MIMRKYKTVGNRGLFDEEENQQRKIKNPSKSGACIWIYGAEYEWLGYQICGYKKSNRYHRID